MHASEIIIKNSEKLLALCNKIDVPVRLSGIYMDDTDSCEVFRLRLKQMQNGGLASEPERKSVEKATALIKRELSLCSVAPIQNVMDDSIEIEVRLYSHKRTWTLTSLVSSGSYVEILLSWILYGSVVAFVTLAYMHRPSYALD